MLVASLKLAKKYDYLEDKFTKAYRLACQYRYQEPREWPL